MAKIGSSQQPAAPLGGRRIGAATHASDGTGAALPIPAGPSPGTLAERLENATLAGQISTVPPAYDDGANGNDWETILGDDVFARLYLSAPHHAQVTDAQVAANHTVLAGFWTAKRNRFLTGDRDVEDLYRPGTVTKAQAQLDAAAAALANAAGRAACFAQLDGRRRAEAGRQLDGYLVLLLQSQVLNNKMFQLALRQGEAFGFAPAEAEAHLLHSIRQAGFAPVRTVGQSPNLLLAEWTPGGVPLTNRPSTKVMGHDVYTLAEAGQVLHAAYTIGTEREKAARNLDSGDYLENIAKDLRENDVQLDLREVFLDKKPTAEQRRLRALYTLGPGLPFDVGGVVPAFASPADLLTRAARSAKDFGVAEAAFTAGLLPIWLRAAATAEVRAALPAQHTALDFRRFLHQAAPAFPLWIGSEKLADPAALAAYIRRDENTWKMVYGSLNAGNLGPWLAALGQSPVLARQEQLAQALVGPNEGAVGAGPGISPADARRLLSIQALLEALEPQMPVPQLVADITEVNLTGLSGEALTERVITFTNTTGGPVRVSFALEPALEGVRLSVPGLFFDQRAPGQRLAVALTGNPALMPRNGQHTGQLQVRTAYAAVSVPVRASAVFPQREFWQFVVGSGLALAAMLGGGRYLLALALADTPAQTLLDRGGWVPLSQATDLTAAQSLPFLLALLALGGLLFAFGKTLARLAKPRPTT